MAFLVVALILWVLALITHPLATIVITLVIAGVAGACAAGGRQGDGTGHHGGRWLS